MIEMTPTRIAGILLCAAAALFAIYLLVMWLADRAIDSLNAMTRHERRVRTRRSVYQARCSTVPDMTRVEFVLLFVILVALGGLMFLSTTWIGQEFVDYVTGVLRLAPPK